MGRRALALRKSSAAMRPFKILYDHAWSSILQEQRCQLDGLAVVVQRHQQNKRFQRLHDLDELLVQAEHLNSWYQTLVKGWADHLGFEHHAAALKSRVRVTQKILRSYKGNASAVLDLVRATIVVDNISEIILVVGLVTAEAIVHTIKNRFAPDYNCEQTGGYRDVNMHLSFED